MSKGNFRCNYRIILSSCPNTRVAKRIAATLVRERLAACVNIIPAIQSVFRWRGGIETAWEALLVIKARGSDYRHIERRLLALHPYELPEIISVPIAKGYSRYLAWLTNPDKI